MVEIALLDCTLRDGGYINQWKFGAKQINGIIRNLEQADIDIIECGFLRDVKDDENICVFSDPQKVNNLLENRRKDIMYVAMLEYGKIPASRITPRTKGTVDGIRLTFHKADWKEAKKVCLCLKEKGYHVFVQPVGTTTYSDEELISLMQEVNEIKPYAFYLVDTLGRMYPKDLLHLLALTLEHLAPDIQIGFHSHNNLQLSFANAMELVKNSQERKIIVDCSVYGMGRGAGNLATELFADYINSNLGMRYKIFPLLAIADNYLMNVYQKNRWGYDLPYFMSAIQNCHPNYAAHLMQKQTMDIQDIGRLLSLIPADRMGQYNSETIESIYLQHQKMRIDDGDEIEELTQVFKGKDVLIIGSGKTVESCRDEIEKYQNEVKPITVSVNFCPNAYHVDWVFISNQRRLEGLLGQKDNVPPMIATSNLMKKIDTSVHWVNFETYLGEGREIDNSGCMLIRLLKRVGIAKIAIAGFDGYDSDEHANTYVKNYSVSIDGAVALQKNIDISKQLKMALQDIEYRFITPTRYKI